MVAKNIVIPLEAEYLNEAAKARGITRTSLVRIVMEKVVSERLVSSLLGDEKIVIPKKPKYRRFPPKG
jgi:hypothetical protein